MITKRITLPVAAAGVALLSAYAVAPSPARVGTDCHLMAQPMLTAQTFPEHFDGTFLWDGSSDPQRASLDITNVAMEVVDGDPVLIATGRGTYVHYRVAHFSFEIVADPQTGDFSMTEFDPSVSSGFITDGVHRGRFSQAGTALIGRWTDAEGGAGTLALEAVSSTSRPAELPPAFESSREHVDIDLEKFEAWADDLGVPPELPDQDAWRRAGGDMVSLGVDHAELPRGVYVSWAPEHAETLPGATRRVWLRASDDDRCVESEVDQVRVHYAGWNIEGRFDSSWQRGQSATFQPNRLIPGFAEALDGACVGDYLRAWIPAEQAYGSARGGGRPAGDLVFDIEILDVRH